MPGVQAAHTSRSRPQLWLVGLVALSLASASVPLVYLGVRASAVPFSSDSGNSFQAPGGDAGGEHDWSFPIGSAQCGDHGNNDRGDLVAPAGGRKSHYGCWFLLFP